MSFSPAFYIDDDDDFADEEKESNPLTITTTTTKATTRIGKTKRRRRLLATSGEDDCCRLWTTTEWCHSGDCDDEKEEEEEQQQQQVLLEPKPYGLSVLRGHSDAVLKCAFGASSSAGINDGEKSCSRLSSFVLATGSSNGEVFLWRVVRQSGKEKDGEGGDGLLAKFDANRRRGGEIGARADGGGGEGGGEEEDSNNNEVYGLKFLGARDQYLVIATDAELIGVEVTRNVSEDGSSSVGELKEIARAPIGFALNESEGDANSQRGKFDIAYAFAMDAYAMNSRCSNSKRHDAHVLFRC